MHKSVGFDYDVVLRFFKKKNKDGDGCTYYAEVIKDRTGVTKVGSIVENPCPRTRPKRQPGHHAGN